ncbi:MAG: YchF family ATPase [Actinomycetota bacterium]|nr:YchF family ATPase [Actinomycetota bacterium]
MKSVGIIGLPHSGKTTLFTALTKAGSAGGRSNQAVVGVPDERIDELARIEASRKRVASRVRFVDVPGGLTAKGIAEFRNMDALCIVVRCFGAGADPGGELGAVEAELVLADLGSLENGLDKVQKRARGSAEGKIEAGVLARSYSWLEGERPLREADLDDDELKVLRGYGPLTLKPWILVANVAEDAMGPGAPEGLPESAISINASLEAEVAGLEDSDAAELLEGFGVAEPGLRRVIGACYRALDLITFLTTGTDETRAWEVRRGAKAPEAAGVIHSDLERGFIRAEVVAYDDLVQAGSWDEAKAGGRLRVEGKGYTVREGDVLNIRFAV